MAEIEIPLATTTIAGLQFRGQAARDELWQIEANTLLLLEPEPTNKYDSNAIRVVSPLRDSVEGEPEDTSGGVFLGYIPRTANTVVLEFMQAPRRVECRLMEKGCDLINIVGFEPAEQGPPITDS